jgi:hypothetical protein
MTWDILPQGAMLRQGWQAGLPRLPLTSRVIDPALWLGAIASLHVLIVSRLPEVIKGGREEHGVRCLSLAQHSPRT